MRHIFGVLALLALASRPALAQQNPPLRNGLTDHCIRFGAALSPTPQNIIRLLWEKQSGLRLDGVFVGHVVEGSAAARAGIKPNDVILKFGNINIVTAFALSKVQIAIKMMPDGTIIPVTIFRDGDEQVLTVRIDPKCEEEKEVELKAEAEELLPKLYHEYLYLQVCAERLPEFETAKSSLKDAIKVKEAHVPRDQVDTIWKETAETFQKEEPGIEKLNDFNLHTVCESRNRMSMELTGRKTEPQRPPFIKKDF